jgi:putative copper resistance protein D
MVLLALLAAEHALAGRRARSSVLGACLAAAALATLAWSGHAVATAPPLRSLHLAADAAHLIAAALWLGALVPLIFVLARAREQDGAWAALAMRTTRRFSSLGVVAVAGLLLTGIVNTWVLLGGIAAFAETAYGRLLAIKIALFVLIVAIAAFNRSRLVPRMRATTGAGEALPTLRRNAIAEIVVGAGILLIVGALGITPPAAHEHGPMRHHSAMHAP